MNISNNTNPIHDNTEVPPFFAAITFNSSILAAGFSFYILSTFLFSISFRVTFNASKFPCISEIIAIFIIL